MTFLKSTLFIFLVVNLYACSSREKTSRTVTEMEFFVDSNLVDTPVKDSALSIYYAVPGTWKDVQTSDSASMLLHLANNIKVNKLLRNAANTVVFSLTDVRLVPDSIFMRMDEQYKTALNPTGKWNHIDRAEYRTAGFEVKQYILSKQGEANFKLLFADKGKPSFQVDYSVIIDSAYALNTKTFESIIGSLKRDH